MIKINTSGDYVQLIYVDPVQESVQQELRSDTDAFECSYDSDGKLFMQFGAMRFENPDPTDFTINDVAVTDAADFISKLNALFTGGGGGGATIYTGNGSLSGDRIIDLDDHNFFFDYDGQHFFSIVLTEGEEKYEITVPSSENPPAYSTLKISSNSDDGYKFFIQAHDENTGSVAIVGNVVDNTITYTAGVHSIRNAIVATDLLLLDFVDDAAAAAGGVVIGQLYHNSGALRIRLS